MSFKKLIILGSLLFSLFNSAYATSKVAPIERDEAVQNAVLFYINQYRQQHGLAKLNMDQRIVTVAKQHSLNMANHNTPFGHKNFTKRVTVLRTQIKNFNGGGENVAFNYKDARTVVANWVTSPGHKRNIMGSYNLTGIGVARDKQGRLYYTQIFVRTGATTKRSMARRAFFIFG